MGVALKPERLSVVVAVSPVDAPAAVVDEDMRSKRNQELARQDATVIANRLFDCMQKDEFPERGDLHLFGLGGEYHARAQEVLGVWQGCVKCGDITEPMLADALYNGTVKEFFEAACYKF